MRSASIILFAALGAVALAGETQPVGPPWVTDFRKAQVEGLESGKPIFIYLTKTH